MQSIVAAGPTNPWTSRKRKQVKQYKLKNESGKFFVLGSGFVGTESEGSLLNEGNLTCAVGLGFKGLTVEVTKSYAVVYIRAGDAVSLTGVSKKVGDLSKNQLDPSKRRFATFKEAAIHAGRFHTRRANRTDAVNSGTAGHVGAFVVETTDPVNSYVNPGTGLTNTIKG